VKATLNNNAGIPEFLLSSQRFGIQLGLVRMESLLTRLGNPQENLSYIHIAGTNGKGSVTSYIASMLASDNYRVGVYTSPFLERFSERIRVLDGKNSLVSFLADDAQGEIPVKDLFKLSEKVREAVAGMLEDKEEHPTEFELVTAVAFLYFKQMACDYVVLETGLGGRLDSTNIIINSVCSVITALGYDHMDQLGNTISEIVREKAGIIKPNGNVFLYSPYDTDLSEKEAGEALAVMIETCRERSANLTIVSACELTRVKSSVDGQDFTVPYLPGILRISMIGGYQLQNAALAVRAVTGLVSESGIREGLLLTRWKGRMEVLRRNPLILLDGGHNPQGARSFRDSVNDLFADDFRKNPPRLILGFMEDKDYPQILTVLFSGLPYHIREIICVTPDNPRALPAEKLKKYISDHFSEEALFYKNQTTMYNRQGRISAFEEAKSACFKALEDSKADGAPILCLGSLYLAGQVRDTLKMDI